MPRLFCGSWTTTLHPGGAKDVFLLSKTPLSILYADRWGFIHKGHSKFSIFTESGISQHHRWRGKSGLTFNKPKIKWSLNMPIEFSAVLVRCMCKGTSWSSALLLLRHALTTSKHSLSITWILGKNLRLHIIVWNLAILLSYLSAAFVLSGSVRIALE